MNAEKIKKAREICEQINENLRDTGNYGDVVDGCEIAVNYLPVALDEIERLQKENEIMRAALDELSRLGNGTRLGNSNGNCIAQRALRNVGIEVL